MCGEGLLRAGADSCLADNTCGSGAAAGAGYFGMKYPNEFNEEEGTVFYSGTTRGALVGAASGVLLGFILDLLDD